MKDFPQWKSVALADEPAVARIVAIATVLSHRMVLFRSVFSRGSAFGWR